MSWLKAGAGAVGTSTPTPPLFSVSCRGTTRQGDVDVFVIVVFHFVDNVEQAAVACTVPPPNCIGGAAVGPERTRVAARVVELLAGIGG